VITFEQLLKAFEDAKSGEASAFTTAEVAERLGINLVKARSIVKVALANGIVSVTRKSVRYMDGRVCPTAAYRLIQKSKKK
jgi:DNA-binding transcriptional regulator LsrR (DeoR family)